MNKKYYNGFKSRYNNIGRKIKSFAVKQAMFFMISCCILGLIIMFEDGTLISWGVVLIVIGIFCSSVSTYILYGFGELIDKACQISDSINNLKVNDVNYKTDDSLECVIKEDNVIDTGVDIDKIKENDIMFFNALIKYLLIIIGIIIFIWLFNN